MENSIFPYEGIFTTLVMGTQDSKSPSGAIAYSGWGLALLGVLHPAQTQAQPVQPMHPPLAPPEATMQLSLRPAIAGTDQALQPAIAAPETQLPGQPVVEFRSQDVVQAQAIPGLVQANPGLPPIRDLQPPVQPLPAPLPVPDPLPPPEQLLPPNPNNPTSPAQPILPDAVPQTIVVKQFQVVGSTVFSAEDFEAITRPFTGGAVSLADLFKARTAVTDLYLKRGYITSGAFLPQQTLRDGIVVIQVVEGSLEAIQVTGTQRLDPGYVQSRLARFAGTPVNRDRLLEGLQLLQLNPLIEGISAELAAGTRQGTNLLKVTVKEAPTFSSQVLFDNARSPSIGTDRRQIQMSEANVLGLGDAISIGYTNTDGSNSLDTSYSIPLSPDNTTLSLGYGLSGSRVLERPFNILDITSQSQYYELTLRHPMLQTPSQNLNVGVTLSHRVSQAFLFNGLLPFPAPGADEVGRTRVSALRFFQEYTQRNSQEVLAFRSQVNVGLDFLGATNNINTGEPDSRFYSWRGQAQYVRLLAPDTLLLVRGDVQLSDRPLLSLEQFNLGGIESVRGYRQDFLLADNGLFASMAVRIPLLRIPEVNGLLQIEPFLDYGMAWNQPGNGPLTTNTLLSTGISARLQLFNRLSSQVTWGIPLMSGRQGGTTLQENGLSFALIYRLF